jgi:hypothetical protein
MRRGAHEKPHRTVIRSVRFAPEEWTRVVAKAAVARLSPSRCVRQAALGARFSGRVDDEAVRQLARVGNNLNQLAKLANAQQRVELSRRLGEVLEQVEQALGRFV